MGLELNKTKIFCAITRKFIWQDVQSENPAIFSLNLRGGDVECSAVHNGLVGWPWVWSPTASITLCLPRFQPTSELWLQRNRKDGFHPPPTVHRDVSTGHQSDKHYCNDTIII